MENNEAFEQLIFTLQNRLTPTLYFVCCENQTVEKDIKTKVESQLTQYKHYTLDLGKYNIESVSDAINKHLPTDVLNSQPLQYMVHIMGLENSLFTQKDGKFADSTLTNEMNFERETLFNGYPFISCIWGSQYFYHQVFVNAPDLSNWLINYYNFKATETQKSITKIGVEDNIEKRGLIKERTDQIEKLEDLLERLDRENPDQEKIQKEKINAYFLLGSEYRNGFFLNKAEDYLLKAKNLADAILSNSFTQINIIYNLGITYAENKEYDKALLCYKQCLDYWIVNDDKNTGICYDVIGRVYYAQGILDEALKSYSSAIEKAKKYKNEESLSINHHQIGMVYKKQKKWEEALIHYFKSLELKIKNKWELDIGGTYIEIGSVYRNQKKYEEALKNYTQAIEWSIKTNNEYSLGISYFNVGFAYEMQSDFLNSKKYFELVISIYKQINHPDLLNAFQRLVWVEAQLASN